MVFIIMNTESHSLSYNQIYIKGSWHAENMMWMLSTQAPLDFVGEHPAPDKLSEECIVSNCTVVIAMLKSQSLDLK